MASRDSLKPTNHMTSDSLSPKQGKAKSKSKKKKNISRAGKNKYAPTNETGFNQLMLKKDKENKDRLQTDEEYSSLFKQSEITYQKMLDMIEEAKKDGHYWGWKYLEKILRSEISDYNFESVMRNISNFDQSEILSSAERACFASSQNEVMTNVSYIATVIKGSILTAEESKEISDIADKDDSYTDYSS